jgi:hypothetical protein
MVFSSSWTKQRTISFYPKKYNTVSNKTKCSRYYYFAEVNLATERKTDSESIKNKWNLKWIGRRERESEFVRNLVFGWQKMIRESEEGFR